MAIVVVIGCAVQGGPGQGGPGEAPTTNGITIDLGPHPMVTIVRVWALMGWGPTLAPVLVPEPMVGVEHGIEDPIENGQLGLAGDEGDPGQPVQIID